jgi:hypothetical protein
MNNQEVYWTDKLYGGPSFLPTSEQGFLALLYVTFNRS